MIGSGNVCGSSVAGIGYCVGELPEIVGLSYDVRWRVGICLCCGLSSLRLSNTWISPLAPKSCSDDTPLDVIFAKAKESAT